MHICQQELIMLLTLVEQLPMLMTYIRVWRTGHNATVEIKYD